MNSQVKSSSARIHLAPGHVRARMGKNISEIVEYRVIARTISGEEDIVQVFPADQCSEAYATADALERVDRRDWSEVFVRKVFEYNLIRQSN
jgi:hypothetical protein